MILKIKRMLLVVMMLIITFCCGSEEVKAYFQFNKNSSINFTTAGYSALTLATDKSVYGLCSSDASISLTVTNPNDYAVTYTIGFSNTALTYKIDGASGATYTVNANGSKTHTIVASGTTSTTSLTITVSPTGPYKSSHTKSVTLDVTCPTSSITSTNNVATSQTATLSCSDAEGMSSYYWGTKSSPATSEYTTITSNLSTTKTVSSAGTYYLICKDKNGNTTTTSKTYYKTTLTMANGSVSPTSVITMSGNSFALPTPTASTGYTNKGAWYTSTAYSTSAGNYGASYKPTASATLYSTATANTYTVSYSCSSGTGTAPASQTATYDSSFAIASNTCTKTGYTFAGWTVNSNEAADSNGWTGWSGTWKYVNGQYGIANGKLQLYARWTVNSYKLTYDCSTNGGSGDTSATINYNAAADLTKTCTKSGWKFVGWNTSSTATTALSSFNMPAAADTLYAIYSKEVTVTFNANGCTTAAGSAKKTIYNTATTASVTVPTATLNSGWSNLKGATSSGATSGTAVGSALSVSVSSTATTATAYYICNKEVTVTFNANGCTTAAGSAKKTIYNGATTASVTVPEATLNSGWSNLKGATSSGATSGTAVGSALSVSVSSNATTATAYYICNKEVTVTFNANGCTTADGSATMTLRNGGTSGSVTVPTKTMNTNWTTLGASASASSTSSGTAMGSSMTISGVASATTSVTRYYNCSKAVTLTATFAANGGSANTSASKSTTIYNGATTASASFTAPSCTTRTGYTCLGYNTSSSATSASLAVGGSVTVSGFSVASSATTASKASGYYHTWKANTYTIKYDYENNIYNPDTSSWTYYGNSAVNSSYTYNSTVGVAVYSNTSAYTGVRIPTNSDKKTNTNYELSVMAYRTGSFTGNLRVYASTYNSSNSVISYNHGISINTSGLTTNTWKKYSYSFNSGAYATWPTIFIDYDAASQGPVYVSDIRLDQVDSVSKTYGTTLGTLPTPTRTGYTFKGWYTAASGGTQISSTTSVPATNTTYYARWADETVPVCTFGSWAVSEIWQEQTTTIDLTCTDSGTGIATTSLTSSSFTVSNANIIGISSITSSGSSSSRVFTITVQGGSTAGNATISLIAGKVVDGAGNGAAAKTSASLTNKVDTTGPIIEFNPDGNSTPKKSHSTTVTVTDSSSLSVLKYYWTQTSGASASSGTDFTLNADNQYTNTRSTGNGNWYLCVYAKDSRGNATNTCSKAFNFDNTKPTLSIETCIPINKTTTTKDLATATDVNTVTLTTSPTTVTPTSYTGQSVTFTATDSAGNSTSQTVTLSVYTKITDSASIVSSTISSGDRNDDIGYNAGTLYEDPYTAGRYIYVGTNPNNYITFAGSTWRIVAIESDGRYKIVNLNSGLTDIEYEEDKSRYNSNSYCNGATSYGCNAWGTTPPLAGTYSAAISKVSYLNNYLNTTYLNSLSNTTGMLTNTPFPVGGISYGDTTDFSSIQSQENAITENGTIGLLTMSDYLLASTDGICVQSTMYRATQTGTSAGYCNDYNWLRPNDSYKFWIMTSPTNSRYMQYRIRAKNSSGSPIERTWASSGYTAEARPVVYLANTTTFTGTGTSSDPYKINTSCSVSSVSNVTCTIVSNTSTALTTWEESKNVKISPSSTTGITYSWDGKNYSSTATKTITTPGVYTAFIKDSRGATNKCSITINSRQEWRSASCTVTPTYGSWYETSAVHNSTTCSAWTGTTTRMTCPGTYLAYGTCTYQINAQLNQMASSMNDCGGRCSQFLSSNSEAMQDTGGTCDCDCKATKQYWSRSCTCSSWSSWDAWEPTEKEGNNCTTKSEERTALSTSTP